MRSPPTVLIFTYPEHGQANVNLATAYELALSGVNVHIASFASLRDRVSRLQELINHHASRSNGKLTGSVFFQECEGITPYMQAVKKRGVSPANLPHPHGVLGALGSYTKLDIMCFPWGQEEYLAAVESIKKIILTIGPNMVFMVILPNSIREVVMPVQPNLAGLWKYPALSSGFQFPLQWWQILINIYLAIRVFVQLMTAPNLKQVQALRKSLGFKPMFIDLPFPGVSYICPALAETDWPFAVVPEQIRLCGPIVMPFDPLEESDPSLLEWLDNGPTVIINLGSHALSDTNTAREMAGAIRILMDYHDRKRSNKIQVLWKAKANGDIKKVIDEIIGKEIREGRVKVPAWLEAEPVSVLQHRNVVCTVHHGGANSFYEGIWSGVPHVVLPVWFDTYDYANRAELLNIGIFGSKSCAPNVRAEELGKALVRVTGDSAEAVGFRTAAKRLKELCRVKGNGRELSSQAILKEIGVRN